MCAVRSKGVWCLREHTRSNVPLGHGVAAQALGGGQGPGQARLGCNHARRSDVLLCLRGASGPLCPRAQHKCWECQTRAAQRKTSTFFLGLRFFLAAGLSAASVPRLGSSGGSLSGTPVLGSSVNGRLWAAADSSSSATTRLICYTALPRGATTRPIDGARIGVRATGRCPHAPSIGGALDLVSIVAISRECTQPGLQLQRTSPR